MRNEREEDYPAVSELVKAAFATVEDSDGTEADYLLEVRKKETFLPELSFVAQEESGKIVGQIVLYGTQIETKSGSIQTLVLSPLSVHPNYFRRGIARMLIEQAHKKAKQMGYTSVFLCGDPRFYKQFGYRASYEFGIYHNNDPNAEWCMVRELVPHSLRTVKGTIDIV